MKYEVLVFSYQTDSQIAKKVLEDFIFFSNDKLKLNFKCSIKLGANLFITYNNPASGII